eukprot:TRINITY_DN69730_c0_g1_i1.p1 TRINITY_DN69730_c0_g1~~TRINITY_DN69730_c0_g1_i1.p1  ORF type:complete len:163 (-),score=16.35 TRINITY_DN69730_c0_g1_i1:73-561(-)
MPSASSSRSPDAEPAPARSGTRPRTPRTIGEVAGAKSAPNTKPEAKKRKKILPPPDKVIEVTGAGSAKVNGRYERIAKDAFDAPAYRNEHGMGLMQYHLPRIFAPFWYFSTNYGKICTNDGEYYRAPCGYGDAAPEPDVAFEVMDGGKLPLPEITVVEVSTE